MNKHAYLILAHTNWKQLSILIELIDDARNDIYLHIDKKSAFGEEDRRGIVKAATRSHIYFVKRYRIAWGGYNIVKAEVELLKSSISRMFYSYYHLLSGMDLPIKSQDAIHSFFDENQGKEFISFVSENNLEVLKPRLKYYWFLQNYLGHSSSNKLLRQLETKCISMQEKLGVDRIHGYTFSKGAQWFSITDKLARYVCRHEDKIKKRLRFTFCGDESMVQPLVLDSPYRENVYTPSIGENNIMRYIDWKQGRPYTFQLSDYNELMGSKCLFARKFDMQKDDMIIQRVFDTLKRNS